MAQWLTAHVCVRFSHCLKFNYPYWQLFFIRLFFTRLDWISNRFDPIPHAHTHFLHLLTSGGFNLKYPTIKGWINPMSVKFCPYRDDMC